MPATLHFSNSLDTLADRLIENIQAPDADPFATTAIATPASALRDWLKVRIAEKTGIAANIAFPPLENLLWDRLAERDRFRENPDEPDRLPARLLDSFSFQGLVLSRLRRDPPAALRAYLTSPHPEDAARRACQLAGQLASLFREYEYNRVAEPGYAGLTESWMKGEPSFARHLVRGHRPDATDGRMPVTHLTDVQALEEWQLDIYHSLFERGGLRDRWGEAVKTYRYTLPQYAHMALEKPVAPPDAGRVYHLFGLSNISPFHRDLIGQLADAEKLGEGAARFVIYALNPCAEYWEDVLTLRERRARGWRALTAQPVSAARVAATRLREEELAAGEVSDAEDENGLLALFGKPGRETIKLWCQLTGHDFHENFRAPEKTSLLATVQTSVLRREGPLAVRTPPDESLRFRHATDPRSELEGVRAEIALALAQDPTLRPEDLAIIPTDPASTLPVMRAVFAGDDRLPGNVPLLFPDGGASEESPFLQGFRALLTLAGAEVTRDALQALLGNAAVRRAAGLENLEPSALAGFLEAAGFSRGWNRSGTGAGGESSLEAALDRATLSLAVSGDDGAAAGASLHDLPRPVPGLWHRLDRTEADALLAWLERLRAHLVPLRPGTERGFAEWAGLLRALRDAFLKPAATHPTEVRDAYEVRRFLDEMEVWSAWSQGPDTPPESADIVLVTTLFADRFRDTDSAGRTNFLRGGVRTGPLSALRGLPFRKIWVTGLTT
ncbi:MAG TPA: exodeoxyribonuclease V subunit gamma, partial [Fibrobacteria bacterium]|nr:exodeoxyribonuclease V subunit gamma [Fibrobacteria bacterium]